MLLVVTELLSEFAKNARNVSEDDINGVIRRVAQPSASYKLVIYQSYTKNYQSYMTIRQSYMNN